MESAEALFEVGLRRLFQAEECRLLVLSRPDELPDLVARGMIRRCTIEVFVKMDDPSELIDYEIAYRDEAREMLLSTVVHG